MKKLLLTALILLPVIASAKIPDPKAGSSVCYEGINKDKKIDKRLSKIKIQLSRYKEYSTTLYASIDVVTTKGKSYGNGGAVDKKTATSITAGMDCDGGSFKLTQIDKDAKKVKLQIENISLISDSEGGEGCSTIYIDNKKIAESIVLTRSAKCVHVEPAQ